MAFPGTYDISYYKGDTLEFQIYPKDSNGNAFDLTDFTDVYFTIAETRGSTEGHVSGLVEIRDGYILCVISPTSGASLIAGTKYYYDVEIIAPISIDYSYPRVYTILTGTISVTEQVTLPADEV